MIYRGSQLQAYKMYLNTNLIALLIQTIDSFTYKKNCETFCHTATLLIHNLKYFLIVSCCFTKGINNARV